MSSGCEHWTNKGPVKLFLWEKSAGVSPAPLGTILFVHGSSMAGTPTFDLHVPGRPDSSAMDHFVKLGYDTWCVDMEGYGRSDKSRPINPASSRRTTRSRTTSSTPSSASPRRSTAGLRELP